ncbi:MAG TPA: phosphotransferase [Roseiflexaceae bacterium]|nr:phosphotransferase [Roseiflexaceae bacterium]
MSDQLAIAHSIFSARALAADVLPAYPIGRVTDCRFLSLGVNDTYLVTANADDRYILRLYRAGWRSLSEIAYELEALRHLGGRGVAVAAPLACREGRLVQTIAAPEGPRYAVLFGYAPGRAPSYRESPDDAAFRYGQAVARIHAASDDFHSAQPRFRIDLAHLLEEPLAALGRLLAQRPGDRRSLEELAGRIRAALACLPLDTLEQGFCHGDCHGGNAHTGAAQELTFFDFDCCGHGWRAYDLAVFRWSTCLHSKEKEQALWPPFLRGYLSVRALAAADLRAVPLFVGARQIWLMGLHADGAPVWGHGSLDDAYFERALAFLRDWAAEALGA